MAELEFQDLSFEDKSGKIKVNFLRIFYFYLSKKDLGKIGDFVIEQDKIVFKNIQQKKAERRFYTLLGRGFNDLKNKISNKKTIYVHKNSGIHLIGNVAFGLIDRNTNIIEVKPITGCNLKCIYCSVDEDKRPVDFVIEEDYLVEELKKLVKFKKVDNIEADDTVADDIRAGGIEAHIASQGEPLLYAPLEDLIRGISKIREVRTISIDTNGVMLTKGRVDKLISAGLTRFNFSINSLDEKLAGKIAGASYNVARIKEICRYIAKRAKLIITPVLIPGMNEEEIPKIIEFAKEIKADIGIQNFLNYNLGRNPVKQMDFDVFYGRLREWESKYGVRLIKSTEDFGIVRTKPLPKPFGKGDVIKADIMCEGRLPNEKIAVARGRSISVFNCDKEKGRVRLDIKRSKHNIFAGIEL